ncbi:MULTISPECIES: SDR family oxidoreductase [Rhizobium/Agrobacterium group]|uniref:SDR family oxidoreductase n=1 Tax=Rhizobium/Agrobacterium group TaxID=227290 RepID=UPI0022C10C60|nr:MULTISPECIES: SDR family oxidoreductase [Rhizobium/Agrobacterium group]MCZ7484088.1 SDR family oxidoreductase [Rhizobium rhizogenes]MDA5636425.1 SDR family oxidoreductase [Agrobacterium sp. ST15.16.024]MDF1892262.1 SDR family oxidoreductase [Rhizobium rhizogenes]MDO3444632.1 SDR family oxidoreductase [Agrobacterium sp. V1]
MTKPAVLIIGARSDIGNAVAHTFAAGGYAIQLAARNAEGLNIEKSDIELRYGIEVTLHEFDALSIETHEEFLSNLPRLPEIAISTIGLMGRQEESERDPIAASQVMRSNYEGPASILALLANRFEQRASGTLVGISSVAGERGRATNYVYGSAKAAFTAFLSGLRNRLAKRGVHVVTVLPGFVATKMTEGMDLPAALTADPKEVAVAIERAVLRKRNIVYVRPVWQLIMLIIRNIPERFFKMMKI